jgi:hypothetical protein
VDRRIRYQNPWRGIFHDMDGSLTGLGPDTYATKGYKHVQQPECSLDDELFDGVVCDNTVQIRRVAFHGYDPGHFRGQPLYITKYDKRDMDQLTDEEKEAYLDDSANRQRIDFKDKKDPSNGWAVPYVTGHRYRLHWSNHLDFEVMKVQISERWSEGDKNALFVLPFVDAREAINVTRTDTGLQIPNATLLNATSTWTSGHNWLQNATEIREFQFVVNGEDQGIRNLRLHGLQCITGVCKQEEIDDDIPIDPNSKAWSDPLTWPSGEVPEPGDDVHIEPGMNVVLDIQTPILNLVTVNGRLSFLNHETADIHLHAKQVYVRSGELLIGAEGDPYRG